MVNYAECIITTQQLCNIAEQNCSLQASVYSYLQVSLAQVSDCLMDRLPVMPCDGLPSGITRWASPSDWNGQEAQPTVLQLQKIATNNI